MWFQLDSKCISYLLGCFFKIIGIHSVKIEGFI